MTGWCLSLPQEYEHSRPPESGVAPLASASSPKTTPCQLGMQQKKVGGALQPWLAIRLGDGNSKNNSSPLQVGIKLLLD